MSSRPRSSSKEKSSPKDREGSWAAAEEEGGRTDEKEGEVADPAAVADETVAADAGAGAGADADLGDLGRPARAADSICGGGPFTAPVFSTSPLALLDFATSISFLTVSSNPGRSKSRSPTSKSRFHRSSSLIASEVNVRTTENPWFLVREGKHLLSPPCTEH